MKKARKNKNQFISSSKSTSATLSSSFPPINGDKTPRQIRIKKAKNSEKNKKSWNLSPIPFESIISDSHSADLRSPSQFSSQLNSPNSHKKQTNTKTNKRNIVKKEKVKKKKINTKKRSKHKNGSNHHESQDVMKKKLFAMIRKTAKNQKQREKYKENKIKKLQLEMKKKEQKIEKQQQQIISQQHINAQLQKRKKNIKPRLQSQTNALNKENVTYMMEMEKLEHDELIEFKKDESFEIIQKNEKLESVLINDENNEIFGVRIDANNKYSR